MVSFNYSLSIWKDYHRYAIVELGTRQVLWSRTCTVNKLKDLLRQVDDNWRLVRVSNYPFQDKGDLWTVVVDWF